MMQPLFGAGSGFGRPYDLGAQTDLSILAALESDFRDSHEISGCSIVDLHQSDILAGAVKEIHHALSFCLYESTLSPHPIRQGLSRFLRKLA